MIFDIHRLYHISIPCLSPLHTYMKRIAFPLNDKDFIVEYHKTREGPNGFMCYYKNAATYRLDPLEAWRTLGIAKNTDTGKALKQWCLDMDEQHNNTNDDT